MLKKICIIDGQGGGIGATLIKYIKEASGDSVELIGLGTNAIAIAQMLKSGANKGASGENAICRTVYEADCVIGPIAADMLSCARPYCIRLRFFCRSSNAWMDDMPK